MKKTVIILLSALCLFAFASCEKADGEAEYGNLIVYIPQAMTNGIIDNVYDVPSGGLEDTYNFKAETGTVDVFLGVYRSGKINAAEVTVDVLVDEAATQAQAAELGAEVMPAAMYTLPAKATVPAGVNSKTFYLSIPRSALTEAANAGKVYVLCVSIANPTRFELNEDASTVVVRLDVDALKALI